MTERHAVSSDFAEFVFSDVQKVVELSADFDRTLQHRANGRLYG